MNTLNKSIDYSSLERELHKAVCEEELYKLQNDAKFRAVEQNVPTYEHFRQMVNAAHLKPLDKVDFKKKADCSWNGSVIRREEDFIELNPICINSTLSNQHEKINFEAIPKTNEEFCQIWNTLESAEKKLHFLYKIRNILQSKIFATEIPATFLSEFAEFVHSLLEQNSDIIIELLSVISKCNRFKLNLSFLSKKERECYSLILQSLLQIASEKNKNEVISLCEHFEIAI